MQYSVRTSRSRGPDWIFADEEAFQPFRGSIVELFHSRRPDNVGPLMVEVLKPGPSQRKLSVLDSREMDNKFHYRVRVDRQVGWVPAEVLVAGNRREQLRVFHAMKSDNVGLFTREDGWDTFDMMDIG